MRVGDSAVVADRATREVSIESQEMVLTIGQPGELFDSDELSIQVEVELPLLLSGAEVRAFDTRGVPAPRSVVAPC